MKFIKTNLRFSGTLWEPEILSFNSQRRKPSWIYPIFSIHRFRPRQWHEGGTGRLLNFWKRSARRWECQRGWRRLFRVAMGEIESAHLFADGKEITCKAFNCCGSGSVEESFIICRNGSCFHSRCKDTKLYWWTLRELDFLFTRSDKAGAKGIIFQYGNMYYPNTDRYWPARSARSRCRGRTESSLRHDPFQPGSRTGEK